MEGTIRGRIERIRLLLGGFSAKTLERSFRILIQPLLLRLDDAKEGLMRVMREKSASIGHRLELAREALESRSPYSILSRGYALVSDARTMKLLTDATAIERGDPISIQLAKGTLGADVTEVHDEEL
jgi:exodeoxyribonuclease VII large subunit